MKEAEKTTVRTSVDGRIRENTALGAGVHRLICDAPDIARRAAPGQFVQARNWKGSSPLLRRPISIASVSGRGGLELLVKAIGSGTESLCRARPGDPVELIGPLGRPFDPPSPDRDLCLVSGGIGAAPMLYLAFEFIKLQRKRPRGERKKTHFYFGARTGAEMKVLSELKRFADRSEIAFKLATEDGSVGHKGYVTEALEKSLDRSGGIDRIYSCGPPGFFISLAGASERLGVPAFGSLETQMGCGFGVCLGCSIEVRSGDPQKKFPRVCAEGPVFDLADVVWKRIGR